MEQCDTCWIDARAVTEVPANLSVGFEVYIQGPIGISAILKRKSKNSYSLRKIGQHDRCRFGTLREIRADVAHFVTYGNLPQPSGSRW